MGQGGRGGKVRETGAERGKGRAGQRRERKGREWEEVQGRAGKGEGMHESRDMAIGRRDGGGK